LSDDYRAEGRRQVRSFPPIKKIRAPPQGDDARVKTLRGLGERAPRKREEVGEGLFAPPIR